MALFQKKPQTSTSAPLYTLGLEKSKLIVGLGNIGQEYEQTRHNVGFMCVDHIVKALELPEWITKKDLKCYLSIGKLGDKRIIAMKPSTLMNNSGDAVMAVMKFYKIVARDVLVVHDELDIPFGQIRVRETGGSAGHNGIKSIIQKIGSEFGRVRVGIGSPILDDSKFDSADFVLSKFSKDEQSLLNNMQREVTAIATEYIYGENLNIESRSFL
ncbi:aminoacyl-tRNA hydrolase [Candidatus Saccharibacteria bacterium]|nr:aminoacyl-tRNA hydrolase [Candidatus Saccharibacteria bacterium]